MKYIISTIVLLTSTALFADQRFETVGGFCHAVTPQGVQDGNDDNEVFISNCLSSIRQNADGTGSGSYTIEVEYPVGAQPFSHNFKTTGAESGIDCNMVDSNNTTYNTQDWYSVYQFEIDDLNKFRKHLGKPSNKYDYNGNGVVDAQDYSTFIRKTKAEITYTVVCKNGAQQ